MVPSSERKEGDALATMPSACALRARFCGDDSRSTSSVSDWWVRSSSFCCCCSDWIA
ncbi:hypothetical protein BC477_12420 [Clavibacter michiganensis subsp. michiganensis]|uniref:Uncharacterized protein n=1 Tax=Clavibacter michiganensis subsp. michiganensis TaxID=33013 RepID=A0A251XIH6_CLAMM|nr:hypothetical protein BC477_12420 [Clavibacter michiganensis subsp. michiganensis]OUE02602.1 hypothetical protein CMMCAS07_11330 [Clavibacter michiganensis subsp. michiganensis]